jgi:alanine racemase
MVKDNAYHVDAVQVQSILQKSLLSGYQEET